MHYEPQHAYHVYNRGNNKQKIFFSPRNYMYFLEKVKHEWLPWCDIDAYCLMPNHYHFICIPNAEACTYMLQNGVPCSLQQFSAAIGHLQSSYAKAVNNEQNRTGALFQKKAKNRILLDGEGEGKLIMRYYDSCLQYIEQNPVKAGLVQNAADWKWSSVQDRGGLLVRKRSEILLLQE